MKKIILALIAVASLAATGAQAATITLQVDPNVTSPGTVFDVLGDVNPPEPADPAAVVQEINVLIGLPLGGSQPSNFGAQGQTEYRSLNAFSPLPTATLGVPGSGTTISITAAGSYYLAGKYDGPNGGLEVWDIGNLAAGAMINIPQNAFGPGDNTYGLSGWTIVQVTSTNVPDGGATLALLGFALVGVESLRRKLYKP
jgi:hypothetical protein